MPVITSVLAHPRRTDRVTVHLDQRPFAVVPTAALATLALRRGELASDELLAALTSAARTLVTYDRALAMLARGPRTTRELRARLLQKGDLLSDIDEALQRLSASGLLSDEVFARHFARCKLGSGTRAAARVRMDLQRRGVPRELAQRATAEVAVEERIDETDAAVNLARRRLRSLRGLDAATLRRRLSAYLQRRGFNTPQVLAAVAIALTELASDTADTGARED